MKLAFFIFLFPVLSFAASLEELAHSDEWLHLLHMRKNLFRQYESKVQGEGFFLSPDGHKNPLAELEETQKQMFGDNLEQAQKTQCHFLARRDFLLRKGAHEWQQKIQTCQFSKEWLTQLHATKLTLVFASSYMNSAASSFGHTFLKLQNPENTSGKELLDYGVNFSARTKETKGALYALYGLTGYFPGAFAMVPYHQMIKEYTHLEGRDLWEYELDFTPEEVQRVLFHLLELDQVYFDYYFVDDNCSFALLKLLEVGRPGLKLADDEEAFVIPLDTVKAVQPLVKDVRYRASLETEWRQRRDHLTPEQHAELVDFYHHPDPKKTQKLATETLSAATFLFSLKEIENHEKWKQINYELARERARRKQDSETQFQLQKPAESPDQGPHPSALELGYLNQDQKSYLLRGARLAFHEQMSRNVGASPFSHLEVLGFQWQSAYSNQFWLRRYRLLDMLSTQAIDAFEKPLSWSLTIGGDNSGLVPTEVRHQIGGGLGFSFDLFPDKMRFTALLTAAFRGSFEQQFLLNPGVDSRLWILWLPSFRTFAEHQYWKDPNTQVNEFSVFQVFDVTSQLELRAGWRSMHEGAGTSIEQSVSLVQNFLL
jgi:hypothetical protein